MSHSDSTSHMPAQNGANAKSSPSKAKAVAQSARETIDDARDKLGAVAEDGHKAVTTAVDQATLQAREAQNVALEAVRRNPGLAVAGAVGFGVLLGLALSRRS